MYKKRLRAWGFTKNIQESEARSLLIHQLRRMNAQNAAASGTTGDRGGGLQTSDKKLQRYLQRNPYLLWQVGASTGPRRSSQSPQSPATLDDLSDVMSPVDSVEMCCSALLSPSPTIRLSAPASSRDLERTLLAVRCYIQTNKVISETPSTQWRRIMLGHSPNKPVLHLGADLIKFHDTFSFVADALNCNSSPVITQLLQPHFDRIQSLLRQQHPDLISSMMRMSLDMAAKKRPELARIVNNYLLQMTPVMLSPNHPMAVAWVSMQKWHMSEGDENMNEFRKTIMLASETETVEALSARNITGFGTREGPTTIGGVADMDSSSSKSSSTRSSISETTPSECTDAWDDRGDAACNPDGDVVNDDDKNRSTSSGSNKDTITAAPAHEDAPWITERIRNWRSLHLHWSKAQASVGKLDFQTSAVVSQTLADLSVGRIRSAEEGVRRVLEKQERAAQQDAATRSHGTAAPSGSCPADTGDNSTEPTLGSVPNLITWIILVLGMARVRLGDDKVAQEHFRWVIADADCRRDLVARNIGMTMLRYILRDEEKGQVERQSGGKVLEEIRKGKIPPEVWAARSD